MPAKPLRRGRQRPRILSVPGVTMAELEPTWQVLELFEAGQLSAGETIASMRKTLPAGGRGFEAADYGVSIGIEPDPWQALALYLTLLEDEDEGDWNAFESVIIAPRQNGKNGIIEIRELAAIEWGARLIAHTAHRLDTTERSFKRMQRIVESSPDLDLKVRKFNRSNGKEAVEFMNGAEIKYVSRSKGTGRGWDDAELVIFDEAMMSLTPAMLDALVPAMGVANRPQVVYTGSAGLDESVHLRKLRRRALAGEPDLAYLEHSVTPPEDDAQLDLDDPELGYEANPALGIRLTERFLRRERRVLGAEGYAREQLCIWANQGKAPIDPERWAELADDESEVGRQLAFGVALSPGRLAACIALASWRADGLVHVELVHRWPGVSWVPSVGGELERRWRAVGTFVCPDDPGSSALATPKPKLGWHPEIVSGDEMAAGCKELLRDVQLGRLRYIDRPELTASATGVIKQQLDSEFGSDVWVWAPSSPEVDAAPVRAATLAVAGLRGKGRTSRRRRTGKAMAV